MTIRRIQWTNEEVPYLSGQSSIRTVGRIEGYSDLMFVIYNRVAYDDGRPFGCQVLGIEHFFHVPSRQSGEAGTVRVGHKYATGLSVESLQRFVAEQLESWVMGFFEQEDLGTFAKKPFLSLTPVSRYNIIKGETENETSDTAT